jgi:hypothetical protein
MTINDEFFKKTQENLRRIKAQNNQKTLKSYNIDGKAEAEELSVQEESTITSSDNVVSLDAFKRKKQVASQPKSTKVELSTEERMKRVGESIKRINDLMEQLEKNNRKPQS